jgi:hypothetical protein
VGDKAVTYWEFVDDLVRRAAQLSDRSLRGLYWLLAQGLLARCPVPAGWLDTVVAVLACGQRLAVTGGSLPLDEALGRLRAFPVDEDTPQYLMTVLTCANLSVDLDEVSKPAVFVRHALGPIMSTASLMLYGDVAEPATDDEVDEVFRQPLVQRAVDFLSEAVAALQANPEPAGELLEGLRPGAVALAPPEGAPTV